MRICSTSMALMEDCKLPNLFTIMNIKHNDYKKIKARPFLKWAGGKGQLLTEIAEYYPFEKGNINRYVEPFVGGGAVLFDILSKYKLEYVCINDINVDLINTYRTIQRDTDKLIDILENMQEKFLALDTEERKKFFLEQRERYNFLKIRNINNDNNCEKAGLLIFLNKTCFNGLYRVNKKGLFNVPVGSYKKPLICDEENLRTIAKLLQNTEITCGDYTKIADRIDDKTFVYIDPPYRPLNNTSSFTAYTANAFDDDEQIRLSKFVQLISEKGARILESNSDPKNNNSNDDFFDKIYISYNIKRVSATRMINSKSSGRGKISELLISNFRGMQDEKF